MNHLGTKEIQTQRLMLRPFTMDDAEAMYSNWASDPEVTRYLMWDAHTDVSQTRAVTKEWVESYGQPSFYLWAIVLDEPIGTISVVDVSDRDEWLEIGYCLSRKHWGQGIMTEALDCVMRFLFEEVQAHRVHLRHDVLNVGSGRVMIKNGLRYEGTLLGAKRRVDGSWGDMALYGMLREEWMSQQAAE